MVPRSPRTPRLLSQPSSPLSHHAGSAPRPFGSHRFSHPAQQPGQCPSVVLRPRPSCSQGHGHGCSLALVRSPAHSPSSSEKSLFSQSLALPASWASVHAWHMFTVCVTCSAVSTPLCPLELLVDACSRGRWSASSEPARGGVSHGAAHRHLLNGDGTFSGDSGAR